MISFDRKWPVAVFWSAFLAVVAIILYHLPSWGLQDDYQSLNIAKEVWQGPNVIAGWWNVAMQDFIGWGIFRPLYYLTVIITYRFLKDVPWLIYIFVALFNFAAMYIWGLVMARVFNLRKGEARIATYVFPLSYLLFTPFWNIFTHISFQEKYVVLFSAIALVFAEKAYRNNKARYLLPALISVIIGLLTKPTGIYLIMVLIAFAVLDLVFFKYRKAVSLRLLTAFTAFFGLYYWFIKINLRNYAGQYSMTVDSMVGHLMASSVVVKGLAGLALIVALGMFLMIVRKKNDFSPLAITIPFGFLAYILVLAPWALVNYLLSALTPHALGLFFPFYLWLNRRNTFTRAGTNVVLIFLVIVALGFIAIPRFSKLSDIGKTKAFMVSSNRDHHAYFFPPPFSEAAETLAGFSSAHVVYLSDGLLGAELLEGQKSDYLIVNDETSAVTLDGVAVGDVVYENNTWKIFEVVPDEGNRGSFDVDFPENIVERLKSYLRDH